MSPASDVRPLGPVAASLAGPAVLLRNSRSPSISDAAVQQLLASNARPFATFAASAAGPAVLLRSGHRLHHVRTLHGRGGQAPAARGQGIAARAAQLLACLASAPAQDTLAVSTSGGQAASRGRGVAACAAQLPSAWGVGRASRKRMGRPIAARVPPGAAARAAQLLAHAGVDRTGRERASKGCGHCRLTHTCMHAAQHNRCGMVRRTLACQFLCGCYLLALVDASALALGTKQTAHAPSCGAVSLARWLGRASAAVAADCRWA